ncbi:hypothetical protein [Thalassotalea sp. PLHSN55]|uniref:hypothetical protein n=1 Tax=Thalassotalea sp. PLHSN55 TaxID=3435888 RepID=UPI003F825FDA
MIVNPTVETTSLSTSQLRRIYSMRQVRWSDGTAIAVFVLPSQHPVHQRFSKDVLRLFPYQLDRIWNKLTFSGLGLRPILVNSEQELLKKIASVPGAIGYVENKEGVDNVVVIKVND